MNDIDFVRTLGYGSMGSVLMVMLTNGRVTTPYALKVIDKRRVVRQHQVARVMQEKQLLALASHPFVCRLIGTFQDETRLFMLTEFVGGGELFSAMGSATFNDACAHFFAAEVTLVLGHIHSLDIAYRDLKPENIVIDSLGHAKIIDFGLAKVVQTRTYTVCGTVEYMAPEVLSQIGHDKCVDWWALGILIFEMLAFQTPFRGRTARETRKNVLNRDPRCPTHFGSVTKGIVYLLLIKDQTLRLGNGTDGGGRVRSHPWFSSVEWADLLRQRCLSPFLPGVHGDGGTHARGSLPELEADDCAACGLQEVDARAEDGLSEAQQQLFRDF
jgi:serine/threonine protein kinase